MHYIVLKGKWKSVLDYFYVAILWYEAFGVWLVSACQVIICLKQQTDVSCRHIRRDWGIRKLAPVTFLAIVLCKVREY